MQQDGLLSGGGGNEVAASLDEEKICRICLESSDNADPFHEGHLISPCQCRGTSAWVHRGCLDRWRVTQEDRAFSQCTECGFAYEYVERPNDETKGWLFDDGPLTPAVRRKLRFQAAVGRDFLAVFAVFQLCVWSIGLLVRKWDCGKYNDCVGYDPLDDPWNITSKPGYRDDAEYCCPSGFIVNKIPPFTYLNTHTQSAYYLVGMILFFALVGCFGSCNKRCCGDNACCDDSTDCCDCYTYYWWYSPSTSTDDCCCCCCGERGSNHRTHNYHSGVNVSSRGDSSDSDCPGNCNGADCDCDCGGGGGSGGGGGGDMGEAAAFLLVIVVLLIVVFAIIGVMEGIFFISIILQRSMQRHVHMLQKRSLAEHFVVEDLCGLNGCRNVVSVLEARHAGALAVASAPPGLQPPDIERGAELVRTVTAGGRSVVDHRTANRALVKVGLETSKGPVF